VLMRVSEITKLIRGEQRSYCAPRQFSHKRGEAGLAEDGP
jgi:hypothetical protein